MQVCFVELQSHLPLWWSKQTRSFLVRLEICHIGAVQGVLQFIKFTAYSSVAMGMAAIFKHI